ncbi:hypothetical protein JGU71_15790 [Antrihabitans sp. YC3-6]|uniref:Mce-associated membrane protein n=1 Tax=Antrihabitans stalagmiti TaxID=2799499 RepID=A0A934NS82_9NOCA|nr:hypothetical protein [Antrihabitans stalagmiti]MBJ8340354.1 hypothetical protein [Antrihabitans stalagmiti]
MSSDNEQDAENKPDEAVGATPRGRRRSSRPAGPPPGEAHATVVRKPTTSKPVELSKPVAAKADSGAKSTPAPVVATPAEAESKQPRAKRSVRSMVLAGAAALVIVALVVATVVLAIAKRNDDSRDARRGEFVSTARQVVLNMTSFKKDSASDDVKKLLDQSSGEFMQDFGSKSDPLADIVQRLQIDATGDIIESALESDDGDTATVLVVAGMQFTNAGTTELQNRTFRLRVTVTDADGRMTASKVEFVP